MINPEGYIGSAESLQEKACGSGWSLKVVPEKYGELGLTEACKRHDYRYRIGSLPREKVLADLYFLSDLLEALIVDIDVFKIHTLIDCSVMELNATFTQKKTNEIWNKFWKQLRNEVSKSSIGWFRKWFRFGYAKDYYEAVEHLGNNAFYEGKTYMTKNPGFWE